MAAYYLLCPHQDTITQHYDCLPPLAEGEYGWRHTPTVAEQQAILDPPDIDTWPITQRERWRYYAKPWEPKPCHFDRIGEPPDDGRWPAHIVSTGENLGYWGNGVGLYPTIQRIYRCAVHQTPPRRVYSRHFAFHRAWRPLLDARYTRTSFERSERTIRTFFPNPAHAHYWLRYYQLYVPNHVIADSHHVW